MPTLSMYPSRDLPPLVKAQILAFMRIEWTGGYTSEQQFRDEIWPEGEADRTVHFVLEERGFVISQAGVVWKTITHDGVTYKTGGLTGVLTFPDFARRGYGVRVVEAATRYIAEAGADLGLTTCEPTLRSFYARAGWIPLTNTALAHGDPNMPLVLDELVLMLFVSEKGKQGRRSLEGNRCTWARTPGRSISAEHHSVPATGVRRTLLDAKVVVPCQGVVQRDTESRPSGEQLRS